MVLTYEVLPQSSKILVFFILISFNRALLPFFALLSHRFLYSLTSTHSLLLTLLLYSCLSLLDNDLLAFLPPAMLKKICFNLTSFDLSGKGLGFGSLFENYQGVIVFLEVLKLWLFTFVAEWLLIASVREQTGAAKIQRDDAESCEKVLSVQNLCKRYPDEAVLDDLSLDLSQKEILVLLGGNGSGKTTLLRILSGGERQDSGIIQNFRDFTYCPQHDALYEALTAQQHIDVFSCILGVTDAKALEIARRLQLDLSKPVGKMSGGMKRKLQIVLALMRPESIVLMDEPSAGLDNNSRCEMARVLEEERQAGQSIVMSTHLTDEIAELTGRVARMRRGKLQIIGKDEEERVKLRMYFNTLTDMTKASEQLRLLPLISQSDRLLKTLTVYFPTPKTIEVLTSLKPHKDQIIALDLQTQTLDEEQADDDSALEDEIDEQHRSAEEPEDGQCIDEFIEAPSQQRNTTWSLLKMVYRNKILAFLEVLAPFLIILVGLSWCSSHVDSPIRDLKIDKRYIDNIMHGQQIGIDISSHIKQYANVKDFEEDIFKDAIDNPSRYCGVFWFQSDNTTKQFKAALFLNLTSQEATAIYPQIVYEDILRKATGKTHLSFTATTHPFKQTEHQRETEETLNGFLVVVLVALCTALPFVISLIRHIDLRVTGLKHLILSKIMGKWRYTGLWIAIEISKSLVMALGIQIGLGQSVRSDVSITSILLLYAIAVIPFTLALSHMIQESSTAIALGVIYQLITGAVGPILIFILRIIPNTSEYGDQQLNSLRSMSPIFCINNAVLYQISRKKLEFMRQDLSRDPNSFENLDGDKYWLQVHCILWTLLLITLESDFHSYASHLLKRLVLYFHHGSYLESSSFLKAQGYRITIRNLNHFYFSLCQSPHQALTQFNLSNYSRSHGLIGLNGSGKSTVFRCLAQAQKHTQGCIEVPANAETGYCPQNNVVCNKLTVEETLLLFAKVKHEGVMKSMGLEKIKNKLVGILSGGNKRKLQIAIALLNKPGILLLDEPTAGVDLNRKKFKSQNRYQLSLKNYLDANPRSRLIMTTHDMDEAQSLLKSITILKNGVSLYSGSTVTLLARYQNTLTLTIDAQKMNSEQLNGVLEGIKVDEMDCRINARAKFKLIKEEGRHDIDDILKISEALKGCESFTIQSMSLKEIFQDLTGQYLSEE